jgi:hypothetical protein
MHGTKLALGMKKTGVQVTEIEKWVQEKNRRTKNWRAGAGFGLQTEKLEWKRCSAGVEVLAKQDTTSGHRKTDKFKNQNRHQELSARKRHQGRDPATELIREIDDPQRLATDSSGENSKTDWRTP